MQKDINNYTITISRNTLDCWGIGMEYYGLLEFYNADVPSVVARVIRFDFIFFFINLTKFPKVKWRDNNPK
jgi:hypothetical protein